MLDPAAASEGHRGGAEPVYRRREARGDGRASGCAGARDRKSTRLNSSHVRISYAVFCLKKKNVQNRLTLKNLRIDRLACVGFVVALFLVGIDVVSCSLPRLPAHVALICCACSALMSFAT